MAPNTPHKRGAYVRLSATYYQDNALMAAGVQAEALFVRGLAFCADTLSDGYISQAQLRFVGRGLRKPNNLAAVLVQSGVWEEAEGGYNVVRYLAYNRSRADIEGTQSGQSSRKKARSEARAGENADTTADTDASRARTGARARSLEQNRKEKETSVASLPRRADALNKETEEASDGGRLPATVEPSISAADVVAAWVDTQSENGVSPTARSKGMVAREAKSLLESGNDPHRVLAAAVDAGIKGFSNLERELMAMSGRRIPKRITSAPTRDDKVRGLLELVRREEAAAAGGAS